MNRWLQVGLISIGCIAAYFIMRSLPVESCSFLHYGEFVNADGVIEGCGYEETQFFNMQQLRYPIVVTFTPLEPPQKGEPMLAKLTLFTSTGRPIRCDQIAVSHTQRIHALVVDPSLQDYQHVHPQPDGPPGHYMVQLTPQRAGNYRVYLDFINLVNSRRTLLETGFEVGGDATPAVAGHKLVHRQSGIEFRFEPQQKRSTVGQELRFRLTAHAMDGGPTMFAPVMESYAHVVAFDAEGTGFAHLHPQNPFLHNQDPYQPDLEFVFLFDRPGYYRVWAQVDINGEELYVPFDLVIEDLLG